MKLQVTDEVKKAHEETIEDAQNAGIDIAIEDSEYVGDFPAGYAPLNNNLKEA